MIREAIKDDKGNINKLGMLLTKKFEDTNNFYNDIYDKTKKIYVYTVNEKVVAFINLTIVEQEIEILYIVVEEGYRKNGIASMLLNYILNKYKCNFFLEVSVDNIKAINLYKKFNFEIINIRKKYYNNITDALIMERKNI